MSTASVFAQRHTYVPSQDAGVVDFLGFLKSTGRTVATAGPRLVASDGTQREIPEEIYAALLQISEALSAGQGVTVIPTDSQLTTQQAADYLGYSRPTLVKLLESGEVPFTKVGRHRRVLLRDLMGYEEASREIRREALAELSKESAQDGSFFRTPTDYQTR